MCTESKKYEDMYKEKIDLQGFEQPFELIQTKYSSRFQIIERRFVEIIAVNFSLIRNYSEAKFLSQYVIKMGPKK